MSEAEDDATAAVMETAAAAAAAAELLLDDAQITADAVLATAAGVASVLKENTAALSAIEGKLLEQNAYLHQRVHDLGAMITVTRGAIILLWERSGLEAEIGRLELDALPPLAPPIEPPV